MITKVGEERIRWFVVWFDELVNDFFNVFLLEFPIEIRSHVFESI